MALWNSVGHRSVPLRAEDEGDTIATIVSRINFRGAGVTATEANDGLIEVVVPGVSGSQVLTRRTVVAPYVVLPDDAVLHVSGAGTITLPAPSDGRSLRIKRIGATGDVTLSPSSGTIDGAPSVVLSGQYQAIDLVADPANWFVH